MSGIGSGTSTGPRPVDAPRALEVPLEPLLAWFEAGGGVHCSLQGSARDKNLADAGDVDVYIVLSEMTDSRFSRLVEAASETARRLETATGWPWIVETRRAPLKPCPAGDGGRIGQLHLLVDDLASLAALPLALTLHLAHGGDLLRGAELSDLVTIPKDLAPRLSSCRAELERVWDCVEREELPIRAWSFDSFPTLTDSRQPLKSPWERRCLLRLLATVSDRLPISACLDHPRTLIRLAAQPTVSEAIAADIEAWRTLEQAWSEVCDRARPAVAARLDINLLLSAYSESSQRLAPSG